MMRLEDEPAGLRQAALGLEATTGLRFVAHGAHARARHAAQAGAEVEVFVDRELGIDRRLLGQVADHRLRRFGHVEQVVVADRDAPRRGREHAGEHLHGGRLAGAVGAEEAEHLALAQRERDLAHRAVLVVPARQAFGLEERSEMERGVGHGVLDSGGAQF